MTVALAIAWEQRRPRVDVRELIEAADVRQRAEDDRSLLLCPDIAVVTARCAGFEQYQQLGRVRRPQCCSAAIAGDGRLDVLADPRLASKRLADPRRDH